MTYNEVLKKLESIGVEIDYSAIEVSDMNEECENEAEFEQQIRIK